MPRPSAKPAKASGKAKEKTSVAPSRPHFFSIALELREIIYQHVLEDAPSSLTNLLVVNHQLSTEVLPFQFRRHLTFDGQGELLEWLGDIDHQYLCHVADVRFKLHDIDPSKIIGALGKRLAQTNIASVRSSNTNSPPDNPYHEACDAEMKKIGEAFKLIPNVEKLTITTGDAGDPQPPLRMLSAFSRLLAHRFPKLHTIVSYEDAMPMTFLLNKPKLHRLRFPAVSTSSNAEVVEIFSTLSLLDLEIYRLPHHTPPTAPKRRITFPVLRSLQPLRSLLLYNAIDEEAAGDEPDLTYEVLVHCQEALSRHKASLRKFLCLTNPDDDGDDEEDEEWVAESRRALISFLRHAAQRMEIVGLVPGMWRDLDAP